MDQEDHPEEKRPRMDVDVIDTSISATAEAITRPVVGNEHPERTGEVAIRASITIECPCGVDVGISTIQRSTTCQECGRRWTL